MAFGTPVAAAAAYSANGGTSVAPAYPAGILATDAVLLFVGQKPGTANGGTVTTPTGWTLRDSLTAAGGYGTTLGADTGNTNLFVYSWDVPVAGQTGNLTVTLGDNGVAWAFIVRIPKSGLPLTFGSAEGQRTTAAVSPLSIALTTESFRTGDLAIWAMCIPTDVTTPTQFSAQSITGTGLTFSAATELNEPDSQTGSDIGGYSAWATVTSGTSTTAPTVTATVGGTLTNVRGPVVMLRLREANEITPPKLNFSGANYVRNSAMRGAGVGTPGTLPNNWSAVNEGGITHSVVGLGVDGSGREYINIRVAGTATGSFSPGVYVETEAPAAAGESWTVSGYFTLISGTVPAGFQLVRRGLPSGSGFAAAAGITLADITATESRRSLGGSFPSNATTITRAALFIQCNVSNAQVVDFTYRLSGPQLEQNNGVSTFVKTSDDVIVQKLYLPTLGQVQTSTGSLAATETGSDTLAASGQVFVRGSLAATEVASDTLAATGTVLVQGSLSVTEAGADTFSASGTVANPAATGTLAATEVGADTLAATGTVLVRGSLAVTEVGTDTFAATGDVFVQGSLAVTEVGADTLAATGTVLVQGSLAATETGADTFAATGDVIVQGSLSVTEVGVDTFAATGVQTATGSLAVTEVGADTLAATGDVIVQGSLAVTEAGQDTFAATGFQSTSGSLAATEVGSDTLSASGVLPQRIEVSWLEVETVAPGTATGTLAATEVGSDTLAATGTVLVRGSLAVTETTSDTFAATGDVFVTGSLAVTEAGQDTLAATGSVRVQGSLAVTEVGQDTFFATGAQISVGSLAATETGSDTLASTGTVLVKGSLAATETGADTLAATGTVLVRGSLAATETGTDTFSATGDVFVTGTVAATESGSDTLASTGTVLVRGSVAAQEVGADTFASTGSIGTNGSLAVTEVGADTFAATGFQPPRTGIFAAVEAGSDAILVSGKVLVKGALAVTEVGSDDTGGYTDLGYGNPSYFTGIYGQVIVQGSLAVSEVGLDLFDGEGEAIVYGISPSQYLAVVRPSGTAEVPLYTNVAYVEGQKTSAEVFVAPNRASARF